LITSTRFAPAAAQDTLKGFCVPGRGAGGNWDKIGCPRIGQPVCRHFQKRTGFVAREMVYIPKAAAKTQQRTVGRRRSVDIGGGGSGGWSHHGGALSFYFSEKKKKKNARRCGNSSAPEKRDPARGRTVLVRQGPLSDQSRQRTNRAQGRFGRYSDQTGSSTHGIVTAFHQSNTTSRPKPGGGRRTRQGDRRPTLTAR